MWYTKNMTKNSVPKSIFIDISVKNKLKLSFNEYAIAEGIAHLSNQPKFPWCIISKLTLAKFYGMTRKGVQGVIAKLEKMDLIERNSDNELRATQKWYDNFFCPLGAKFGDRGCEELLQGGAKFGDTNETQTSQVGCEELLHNHYQSNIDQYKDLIPKQNLDLLDYIDLQAEEPSPESVASTLMGLFNTLFHTMYRVTPEILKLIKLRLQFFTPEQLTLAVGGLAGSKWHNGESETHYVANPNFLLKSDDQVQKFMKLPSIIDYDIYPELLGKFSCVNDEYCYSVAKSLKLNTGTVIKHRGEFCNRFKDEKRLLRYSDLFRDTLQLLIREGKIQCEE